METTQVGLAASRPLVELKEDQQPLVELEEQDLYQIAGGLFLVIRPPQAEDADTTPDTTPEGASRA